MEELLDLVDGIRDILTPEECARLAGGYGATDDSVANLLMDAVLDEVGRDCDNEDSSSMNEHSKIRQGKLQDLVNEGLTAAVRAGDYNTSRQLLILYTLVASKGQHEKNSARSLPLVTTEEHGEKDKVRSSSLSDIEIDSKAVSKLEKEILIPNITQKNIALNNQSVPPPPPPPPLGTDRLRSATNSDGLLAVLGAAEVLKSMQDGNGKRRTLEAVAAIEE